VWLKTFTCKANTRKPLKIVLATSNKGKIREIKAFLEGFDVVGFEEALTPFEIDETGATFKENALIKAGDVVKIEEFPINIFTVQFYIGKKLASFESKNQHDYFQAYTQKPEWRFLELYPHSQTTISQMFNIQGDIKLIEKDGKVVLQGEGIQKVDVNSGYEKINEFVFE
jgi:hypothetical protein